MLGTVKVDESSLAAARASTIYDYVERESTTIGRCEQAGYNRLRRVPVAYNAKMVDSITACGVAEVQRALDELIRPLFAPPTTSRASAVLAAPKSGLARIRSDFSELGLSLIPTDADDLLLESDFT